MWSPENFSSRNDSVKILSLDKVFYVEKHVNTKFRVVKKVLSQKRQSIQNLVLEKCL